MVFTLLVPSAIAQGPAWARVVSILRDAGVPRESSIARTRHVAVGLHEHAAR